MEILNIIYNYPFLLLGATFVALAFLFKKFRSSNYEPQIFSSSQAVLFRLPETSLQQKILELFEVKQVAEELQVEVFPLGRESTKPQNITKIKRVRRGEIITLDEKQAYGYRFRTRESYRLFSSPWSEEKALIIKSTPFSSPKTITEEMVNQLRSGILNIQRPYRGCIVGARGVGKSSLIISIMNLLRVEAAHPIALDANESVTTESKEHGLVDGKLAFIDTPGTVSNCNFSIFKNIFNGECRKVTDRGMIDGTYENFENDEKKKIDFVLFLVRAPNIKEGKKEEDDDDKSINSQLFEQIKASSLPFVTILTKVDNLQAPGEDKITDYNFWTDPRVVSWCNKVKGSDKKYPLINYQAEEADNIFINYFVASTLVSVMKER